MHDEYLLERGGAARFLWEAKRSRGKIRLTEGDLIPFASLPTPPLMGGWESSACASRSHSSPPPSSPSLNTRSAKKACSSSTRMRQKQKTKHESSQKAQEPHVRHRPGLKYRKTYWRRHFPRLRLRGQPGRSRTDLGHATPAFTGCWWNRISGMNLIRTRLCPSSPSLQQFILELSPLTPI